MSKTTISAQLNQPSEAASAAPTPSGKPAPFNYAAAARSSSSSRPGSGAVTPNPSVSAASTSGNSKTGSDVGSSIASPAATVPAGGMRPNGTGAGGKDTVREKRTSAIGVPKGHNVRPSASGISFGSLAESPFESAVLSSSPANPPTLSKREGTPQFGSMNLNDTKAASTAGISVKSAAATATSSSAAAPAVVPSTRERKKKYDFNSSFTQSSASSAVPSAGAPPSNGSSPSPSQAFRPDPALRRGASPYDPPMPSHSSPASPRPPAHLPPPGGPGPAPSPLSGASQVFTPGRSPQQNCQGFQNGGAPTWQGQGPPPASPHYMPGQLPHMQSYGGPVQGPPGGPYMGAKGPNAPPFSPRNNMGQGGPQGPVYGGPPGGRSGLAASQGRSSQGPTSPRMSNGVPPQGQYPPPQYWQQPPGGPAMYPAQGAYPYPGYHPSQMPTYPNPNHQPTHFQQPGGPGMPITSPQPPHASLPPSSSGPGGSAASTPALSSRTLHPPSAIPPSPASSTPGYGSFSHPPNSAASSATGSIGAGPHGRAPSLSYNAPAFNPNPAVSEFKPNPTATTFTPQRKSAAIAIKKPERTPAIIKEEETAKKKKEEEDAAAEKQKKEEEEDRRRKEEEEAARKKVEADAAEQKRQEEERAAAEARRLKEEEAREKARLEQEAREKAEREAKERLEREAKEKVEQEAKEKAEREAKEKAEREAKEKAEREAKEKAEREAKEKVERMAKEKLEREAKEKSEREAKEKAEAEAKARAEEEATAKVKAEKEAQEAAAFKAAEEKAAAAASLPDPSSLPGLPSRPVNGVVASPTKIRPSPIDLNARPHSRSASGDTLPSAPPSALYSARKIEDLSQVSYPENISSPRPDLNADAPPGKFRYDRDFLLQFMNVCTEKPDQLPSLEAIGMTDTGEPGTFSRSTSFSGTRRGPQGGAPQLNRGVSASVAMGGPMRVGMAGMPMLGGQPPRTSEERFAQASMRSVMGGMGMPIGGGPILNRPPSGQMSRPPSSHGIASLAVSGRERNRSNRGQNRRATTQPVPTSFHGEPIAPLQNSANSWAATRNTNIDEDSPQMVERKVKALLNKLTLDNFDSISDQVLAWANKSEKESDGRILAQVIALVFAKATDEAHWSELYARLCQKLMERVSSSVKDEGVRDTAGNPVSGGYLFRKYLLNRCQEDYEKGWSRRNQLAAAAADKASEDKEKQAANAKSKAEAEAAGKAEAHKEVELLSEEYYAAQKAKRQGLGLVRFIGELFKLGMLTERIMHECIKKLLANVEDPEEDDIESLCRLMLTVGKILDHDKAEKHMRIYFDRMESIVKNSKVGTRARFMLQDVIDTRKNKWQARNEAAGPKLISEIHQEAAKKAADSARQVATSSGKGLPRLNEQLPRGGSRGGQRRDQFTGVGNDGWAQVGNPPPQRPTKAGDLTHFGKIRDASTTGRPTFGPSGVFANKSRKDGKATPDRDAAVTVASNPFAALGADHPGAEGPPSLSRRSSTADPAASFSRPKLNLAPRTLPLPKSTEAAEDAASAADEGPAEDDIDDETAARKVKNSVDEFFHVKSLDEGIASFEALPHARRGQLARGILEKGMDKKLPEVELACSLFRRLSAGMLDKRAFIGVFASTVEQVDDAVVDNPNAYKFCGMLLKAAGLDEADVKSLSEKMEALDDLEEAQTRLMDAFKNAPVS